MSDYLPNSPKPDRDPRNDDPYYEPSSGKGITLVVGILVAIALAAGVMFFVGGGPRDRNEQARLPVQERTMNAPADQSRTPAIQPARPVQPAPPAGSPTAPQQ